MQYIIINTSLNKPFKSKGKVIYFNSMEEAIAFANSFHQYAMGESMLSGDISFVFEVSKIQYRVDIREDLTEDDIIYIDDLKGHENDPI